MAGRGVIGLSYEGREQAHERARAHLEINGLLDATREFNRARMARGKRPLVGKAVRRPEVGMKAGCGCPIACVTQDGRFTISHNEETCKYRCAAMQVVGDGVRNAVGSMQDQPDVLVMTRPELGLLPDEEV